MTYRVLRLLSAALAAWCAIGVPATHATEDAAPSLEDGLKRVLVDFAGSALQRYPGTALSVEAGEQSPRVRLDYSLRSAPFHDHHRLDFRLSGPLQLDNETEKGSTTVFGDAPAFEAAYSFVDWTAGSIEETRATEALCFAFEERLLGQEANTSDCDELLFTSSVASILIKDELLPAGWTRTEAQKRLGHLWLTAYQLAAGIPDACKASGLSIVDGDLPRELQPLVDYGPSYSCDHPDRLLVFRVSAAVGYRNRDRVDGTDASIAEEREYPWTAAATIGFYASTRLSVSAGAFYERFTAGGDEVQICSDAGGPLVCESALSGSTDLESPGVALELAHRLSDDAAYQLSIRHRFDDSQTTVEVPLYILPQLLGPQANGFAGGPALMWDSASDDIEFKIFLGKSFSF